MLVAVAMTPTTAGGAAHSSLTPGFRTPHTGVSHRQRRSSAVEEIVPQAAIMLDAGDLDTGDSRAGQRGQEDPAQRVTKGRAVATLKRFNDILAVGTVGRCLDALDTRLFYFDHIVLTLLIKLLCQEWRR